jgi:hypothetical protein
MDMDDSPQAGWAGFYSWQGMEGYFVTTLILALGHSHPMKLILAAEEINIFLINYCLSFLF